jgi:hypothetical protein
MLPDYRNTVFNEDVLHVLGRLPDNCLDLIYGDPDYNVGIKYAGRSYQQKWEDYIAWYIAVTKECMRVLKKTGNLFMMNYPKQNAHLRVKYLDEAAYAVHDYVWVYNTNVGHSPKKLTTAHRSILHATKSKHNVFYKDNIAVPSLAPPKSGPLPGLAILVPLRINLPKPVLPPIDGGLIPSSSGSLFHASIISSAAACCCVATLTLKGCPFLMKALPRETPPSVLVLLRLSSFLSNAYDCWLFPNQLIGLKPLGLFLSI